MALIAETRSVQKKGSMSRRVLKVTLLTSLLPLGIVLILSALFGRSGLESSAHELLRAQLRGRASFIENWFHFRSVDLRVQSSSEGNIQLLKDLSAGVETSGLTVSEYVGSPDWTSVVDGRGGDLQSFVGLYGYHDAFLVDRDGNLLYSVLGAEDMGSNLFRGALAETKFADACRRALASEGAVLSDLEHYEFSNREVASFFANRIVDGAGEVLGLFAFQLAPEQVEHVLRHQGRDASGAESGVDVYVLGLDSRGENALLRTPPFGDNVQMGDAEHYLDRALDNVQARRWLDHVKGGDASPADEIQTYNGYGGRDVVGLYHPLSIEGLQWAAFAEIPRETAFASADFFEFVLLCMLAITIVFVVVIASWMARRLVTPIVSLSKAAKVVAAGNYDADPLPIEGGEIGELSGNFNSMVQSLVAGEVHQRGQDWLAEGERGLVEMMRGSPNVADLSQDVISYLARYLEAQVGALYVVNGGEVRLAGSHALDVGSTPIACFAVGEGVIGQAAKDGKVVVLDEVAAGHLAAKTGFGERASRQVLVWPVCQGDDVKAVMELGASGAFEPCKSKLLEKVTENLWNALGVAQSMELQTKMLEESQAQSEELAAGEEELIDSNRNLAQETEKLRSSESYVQEKRNELQRANRRLEDQAESLSQASKYKSEFLANMSHELRTPLNSLLILSGSLAGNDEGNLTEDQIEALQVIHGGGKDLLTLVNDILDLSKIEAGKMEVSVGPMELDAMVHGLQGQFRPLAADKGVKLDFELSDLLPRAIQSDFQKVAQVLRNLLSNAIKFTAQGQVRLSISRAAADAKFAREDLIAADTILFAVSDTGIGIPEDKLEAVFESFQQADGSTSRKYGGTGLGLSISRQFAELLGGELQVNSRVGEGSTFTLCLPEAAVGAHDDGIPEHNLAEAPNPTGIAPLGFPAQAPALDDRLSVMPGDRSVLIIQQDAQLATTLQGLCRGRGFQTFVAGSGKEAMKLAFEFQPGAVLLDLNLDDVDGMQVLGELLHECVSPKHAVQVISDQDHEDVVLAMGAKGFTRRPFTDAGIQQMLNALEKHHRPVIKRLLVIEENPSIRELVMEAIEATDVDVVEAVDGAQGLTLLAASDFDGLILTLENDAVGAIDFLGKLESSAIDAPPVFVQAGSGLASRESRGLQDHGCNVVFEDLPKLDLLLEKVNLFMRSEGKNFFGSKGTCSPSKQQPSDELRDKHVLLVDDDMRNTFALSRVLKAKGLRVTLAGDGQQALDALKAKTDISLVIMDMMMPVMDGYEAIRQIRQTPRIAELPVLAVTARALHEDRIKCIEVGATDYLAKPIDVDKLLSLIHVWVADV